MLVLTCCLFQKKTEEARHLSPDFTSACKVASKVELKCYTMTTLQIRFAILFYEGD